MSVWRDSDSLSSWAGLSPANNDSAGKKKSTHVGKGGHYLKPLLVQCALAAIKSTKKHPYFYYKYETLKKRRGHKKAIIAIARKMLVSIYHMIKEDADFQPIDYAQVVTRKQKSNELNLKNIIAFLGEHGADAETIRLVETQCTEKKQATDKDEKTNVGENPQKKEQSKSFAKPITSPEEKTVKKRGRPRKSRQTESQSSPKQPAVATA